MPEALIDKPACFVAGTPVWTNKGLVPIEQLEVGDFVLSRSDITGEQAYKRVLKTLKTEDQEIRTVNFEGYLNGEGSEYLYEFVFATKEHPFYVREHGWITVDEMRGQLLREKRGSFERASGELAITGFPQITLGFPVIQLTDKDNHGFMFIDPLGTDGDFGLSMLFEGKTQTDNFEPVERTHGRRVIYHGATFTCDDVVALDELIEDAWDRTEFTTTVYGIEVENTHTYFVGEMGVLVHDACKHPGVGR